MSLATFMLVLHIAICVAIAAQVVSLLFAADSSSHPRCVHRTNVHELLKHRLQPFAKAMVHTKVRPPRRAKKHRRIAVAPRPVIAISVVNGFSISAIESQVCHFFKESVLLRFSPIFMSSQSTRDSGWSTIFSDLAQRATDQREASSFLLRPSTMEKTTATGSRPSTDANEQEPFQYEHRIPWSYKGHTPSGQQLRRSEEYEKRIKRHWYPYEPTSQEPHRIQTD